MYSAHSSSGGISSSIYLTSDTRISVVSSPRRISLTKCASICIWTYPIRVSAIHWHVGVTILTISSAPRRTPHKILENHNSSCARPSSGSSTKSASGFSSKIRENWLLSLVQFVTVGEMLRNILNPTYPRLSISKIVPIVYPIFKKRWLPLRPYRPSPGNWHIGLRSTEPGSLR